MDVTAANDAGPATGEAARGGVPVRGGAAFCLAEGERGGGVLGAALA